MTVDQMRQCHAYAAKRANVTTGLDQYQWLAIKAALEAMGAPAAGGASPVQSIPAGEPVQDAPAHRQPQPAQV